MKLKEIKIAAFNIIKSTIILRFKPRKKGQCSALGDLGVSVQVAEALDGG